MLLSLETLTRIQQWILGTPNKRKESKRREHYCLFLLCQQAGLRVSEAINFDLSTKTQQGLYQITREVKNAVLLLSQWQKLNYYQQLEQQKSELKAQIIQPPLWKPS